MNFTSSIPHIERLDFFNGQRLFAEDLQTLDGFNRQMRWLHNRSLHTFGIGSGFVVHGERGDREITIEPGYAIDNEGREIILLLPHVATVPPVADDGFGDPRFYDLTVQFPRDEDLEELETRAGICDSHGVVRRREAPVFCWIELNPNSKPKNDTHAEQIAQGVKIVLARISVKNCRLETLSIAQRRNVLPERLPYVACGRTPVGATEWEPWRFQDGSDSDGPTFRTAGVQLQIDTSEAQFTSIPCYTARVVGARHFEGMEGDFTAPMFLEGFTIIDQGATPTQFTLRVWMGWNGSVVLDNEEIFNQGIAAFLREHWHVEWMGVEG